MNRTLALLVVFAIAMALLESSVVVYMRHLYYPDNPLEFIRRVLVTFPGVFSGIGEFSIHKEFVSSKIAGEVATVENKALDRILDFAAEVGLPVVLHCDVDTRLPPDARTSLIYRSS